MSIDIPSVLDNLCFRHPSLLVDDILEHEPGKRLVALKNVTVSEEFFQGHFPGYPVMPGVLIVEAMAQAGCVMMLSGVEDPQNKVPFFAGIDRCKFRRPVVPGDQLRLELEVLRQRGASCKLQGQALVGEELAAEAEIMAVLGERS